MIRVAASCSRSFSFLEETSDDLSPLFGTTYPVNAVEPSLPQNGRRKSTPLPSPSHIC